MLTAQQVDNNIVRVALQTAAAVMGGTQSLHTNSRDEALALPTEASVQVALRTQQIVAYESGLADVVDPLGGSYYVEAMTWVKFVMYCAKYSVNTKLIPHYNIG